jgi:ATP-dependent DNA ligase
MICDKDLEGIVAKHRASPYSASAKWIKIKNTAYTQSERRHELFEAFKFEFRDRAEG